MRSKSTPTVKKIIRLFILLVCSPVLTFMVKLIHRKEGESILKVKLSENIRQFRKTRRMTQEQLAEAMGVSVSAVYKWESNQSTPEIGLILEMADLFHTSTDVLLGYEWRMGGSASVLEKIVMLTKAKEYDEAIPEAEKALKNYPNNFDIVYQSAQLYLEAGAEEESR